MHADAEIIWCVLYERGQLMVYRSEWSQCDRNRSRVSVSVSQTMDGDSCTHHIAMGPGANLHHDLSSWRLALVPWLHSSLRRRSQTVHRHLTQSKHEPIAHCVLSIHFYMHYADCNRAIGQVGSETRVWFDHGEGGTTTAP